MGQGVWARFRQAGPGGQHRRGTQARGPSASALSAWQRRSRRSPESTTGRAKKARSSAWRSSGYMRKRMDDESEKLGLNFTLLATPAEGLSGRFVRIDKKKYGVIPGITDREYYTNSFHIPVYYPINALPQDPAGGALSCIDQRGAHQLCGAGRRHRQECGPHSSPLSAA